MAKDEKNRDVCPICDGTVFEGVELPDTLKCSYCKREKPITEILAYWREPPFFNAKDGTYYDGCYGWN